MIFYMLTKYLLRQNDIYLYNHKQVFYLAVAVEKLLDSAW